MFCHAMFLAAVLALEPALGPDATTVVFEFTMPAFCAPAARRKWVANTLLVLGRATNLYIGLPLGINFGLVEIQGFNDWELDFELFKTAKNSAWNGDFVAGGDVDGDVDSFDGAGEEISFHNVV